MLYQRSLDDRKLGSLLFWFIHIENVHIQLNELSCNYQYCKHWNNWHIVMIPDPSSLL